MYAILKTLCSTTISLLLCACASPCNNVGLFMLYPLVAFNPDTYRGHDGSSFTHAIILNGPKGAQEITAAENAYIVKKFKVDLAGEGGPSAQRKVQSEGASVFHIITFQQTDGKPCTLYFDVTEASR
jgi:hypothetical protein